MASKHGSPKKRSKKFKGIAPHVRLTPVAMPINNEVQAKKRDEQYAMVAKMRAGMGFLGILVVLGARLNIGKRVLETLFTDPENLEKVCAGLAALIQVKVRLDQQKTNLVGATAEECEAIKAALVVVDAVEDSISRVEFAEAARYVNHALGTGANLVKR